MNDGIIYWLVGQRHDEHFVVSLMSLRDHWQGPVTVVAGDDPAEQLARAVGERCGPTDIIRFDYAGYKREHPGKTFYLCKCLLYQYAKYDRTIFLDADTLVVADFPEMWPEYATGEVRLTQFAGWVTTGGTMQGRIEKWRHVRPDDVAMQLTEPFPAINTGVFAFSRKSIEFMTTWLYTTQQNVRFMADELAAQLIFPHFPHVVMDDRFNASPIYSTCSDVRIWHGHGMKFIKNDRGWPLWQPYYARALKANIADIRDWTPRMKELKRRLAGAPPEPDNDE